MKKVIAFLDFVFSGLLVVLSISVPLQAAIPASGRATLIAFYNATDGDNWTSNSGWKGNNNEPDGFSQIGSEGTWYGITVSGNHVTSISFNFNNLYGNIPPELGNLSNLTQLDLDGNELSGSIPAELGNLSNLTQLDLGWNELSGSIPAELGNLNDLTQLDLGWNELSGSIPADLGKLINLNNINLGGNDLEGSIPPELGNLSNLWELDLCCNHLSGSIPPELGNLSYLLLFDLCLNQLSGSIPAELGNLSNLTQLDLGWNELSGSIPAELGNLSNLNDICLGGNDLSGSILPDLGNLFNLEWLGLGSNQLSGSIPVELGNLANLQYIWLYSNKLTGNIPTSLTNLTNLKYEGIAIAYNGLYTNDDILRTFLNSKDLDWEDTQTIAPSNVSAAAISTTSIRVSWTPITYTGESGGYKVYYSTTPGGAGSWMCSGMTSDKSESSYDVTGLYSGTKYYFVVRTQTNPHNENDNTVVSENSEEVSATTTSPLEEKDPPFGSFDTPIHGSTVASSIPVTGWALDDTGIDSVKIYQAQGNSLIYIGDATMVEGARPDVAQLYPEYPNNIRAGWGYMMLTNFLPNSGNGTFVIHAIATDLVGKTTILGTKSIYCDNANAVKPFGAIDTPTQGGVASGSSFVNWGWALTPQPNRIPTDGSTIKVFVDGIEVGHPTYNIYRADIASLFPGYANSDGSAGYFYLDTTAYYNGLHTIQWTALDDAGNADGIGSRYFTIQNSVNRQEASGNSVYSLPASLSVIPACDYRPIQMKIGYDEKNQSQTVIYPDDHGFITIEMRELERLIIDLGHPNCTGFQIFGDQLRTLPIGSFMDIGKGIFYWQPGVGFCGDFEFIFFNINSEPNGIMNRKNITVKIVPKFPNDGHQ